MREIWLGLTEGQGTVIAAIITLVAAMGGVILGWVLFSGRVKSLESALTTSETKMQEHIDRVDETLKGYELKVDEQLAAVLLQLNTLGGAFAERLGQVTSVGAQSEQPAKDIVRENWTRIRERLETV